MQQRSTTFFAPLPLVPRIMLTRKGLGLAPIIGVGYLLLPKVGYRVGIAVGVTRDRLVWIFNGNGTAGAATSAR